MRRAQRGGRPELAATYRAATGTVWTVCAVLDGTDRVVLTTPGPAGPRGAVVDDTAVRHMARVERDEAAAA